MPTKVHKPWLVNVPWLAALSLSIAVLYVLSYAPFVRMRGGLQYAPLPPPTSVWDLHGDPPIVSFGDGRDYPAYRPVDWLIDNTPLRDPLLWWADLFDIGRDMQTAHLYRMVARLPPRDESGP